MLLITLPIFKQTKRWLFFTLILVAASKNALASPLPVNHNLIAFAPEVRLDSGGLCQGIRLKDGHIATSQLCAKAIINQMPHKDFEVTGLYKKPVGLMLEDSPECDSEGCDMLFKIIENDEAPSANSLVFHQENKENLDAYADSLNSDGLLSRSPVNLRFESETDGQKMYSFSQDTSLPPGAPIIDRNGSFICLVTGNKCSSLPAHFHRTKRSEGDNEDGENEGGGIGVGTYVAIGASTVGAALLVNAACLTANLARSCSKGIPCKEFWTVLLTCAYCTAPHTDKCLLFGWGGVLWSWIGAYGTPQAPAPYGRLPQ